MENSSVSVIMCFYNAAQHLVGSLQSLLNQTHSNLQIILVNDGSDDGSAEIVSRFKDGRILFINRPNNIGLTKSLNEALESANGDFIARQDAGDISLPDRIENQLLFMHNNPNIMLTGSAVELFFAGKTLKKYIYPADSERIKKSLYSYSNPIPHSTWLFRRELLSAISGYNNRFELAQDYDFLLRTCENFRIGSVPQPLVRLMYDSESLTYKDNRQLLFGIAALVCAHKRSRGLSDPSLSQNSDWTDLLEKIQAFIDNRNIEKKLESKKHLHSAAFAFAGGNIKHFVINIARSLTGGVLPIEKNLMRIPDDIECLITQTDRFIAEN